MKEAHYLTSANSKDNKPSTPLIQRVKALKYFTPLVVKCEYEIDLRSNEHYLIVKIRPEKFRPVRDLNP